MESVLAPIPVMQRGRLTPLQQISPPGKATTNNDPHPVRPMNQILLQRHGPSAIEAVVNFAALTLSKPRCVLKSSVLHNSICLFRM
jgi:hypothetical protein